MPSIGVLEHYQNPTDRPTRRIKRSGGQSLVRQRVAFWIIENVLLKMLETRQARLVYAASGRQEAQRRAYIPPKMPPVEVPGVYFEDPRNPLRPLAQVVRFQDNESYSN